MLAICASTGDTSASAALYASYLVNGVKSAVLLPQGKVTPQQLGQPLGSGAKVIEIPGVFDDCMKIVEYLSENSAVALMNSKNAWRILGQESYSYEIAQTFDYDVGDLVVVVPIGNAGNITAVLQGFLKLYRSGDHPDLARRSWVCSRNMPIRSICIILRPICRKRRISSRDRAAQRGPGGHDRESGFHAKGDTAWWSNTGHSPGKRLFRWSR